MTRLFARDNILLLLLVFFPVALVLGWVGEVPALAVFIASSLAIIPLAALMGRATERLAHTLGEGAGGLLNATFGNAAELIIAIVALREGYVELVKASITGSIIGNILLVFGASALVGGLKHERQIFNRTAAGLSSTLLVVSVIGLVLPAIFHIVAGGTRGVVVEQELSLEISIVLIAAYILSLLFSLRTHRHLYIGQSSGEEHEAAAGNGGRPRWAIAQLLAATVGIALMSELLVGAVEETAAVFDMNDVFVGVILVALVGNAAEHSTAILMAARNRMDAALTIAIGSSIQVALFVAPVLVFLSYWIAPQPMDLRFTLFEIVAVGLSAWIISLVSQDGESHWMEGVLLLAVYLMMGMAFYWLP